MEQHLLAEEQHNWVTKLLVFDFEIQYMQGVENRASDALSSIMDYGEVAVVTSPDSQEQSEEVLKDNSLK